MHIHGFLTVPFSRSTMFHSTTILAAFVPLVVASGISSGLSGSCSPNFKICAPAGAKTDSLGPIGWAWGNLFIDIVDIVSQYASFPPAAATISPNGPARREQTFCCELVIPKLNLTDHSLGSNVADCLLVPYYDIAMCWVR